MFSEDIFFYTSLLLEQRKTALSNKCKWRTELSFAPPGTNLQGKGTAESSRSHIKRMQRSFCLLILQIYIHTHTHICIWKSLSIYIPCMCTHTTKHVSVYLLKKTTYACVYTFTNGLFTRKKRSPWSASHPTSHRSISTRHGSERLRTLITMLPSIPSTLLLF